MKNILVLCPSHRDHRELAVSKYSETFQFFFHDYTCDELDKSCFDHTIQVTDPRLILERINAQCKNISFDAVISTDDYPGIIFASILAQQLGLCAPHPEHVLLCQHKYYSRQLQREYVPEAVPAFELLDTQVIKKLSFDYPIFIKPVKSFFSAHAHRVESEYHLRTLLQNPLPQNFFEPFNILLREYSTLRIPSHYFIAEQLLQGDQVTVEGFVLNKRTFILGIVDSIMHPGTISFARFDYPSGLPYEVQDRMHEITECVMRGIGFDNGFFNIEMMYNSTTDEIHIIEINPRMASQFSDLYEKVDGVNSYDILLAIALGNQPILCQRQGNYACAASFPLRIFENFKLRKVPTQHDLEKIYAVFPDTRIEIFVEQNKYLSDCLQDGKSYRYALFNLGAQSKKELLEHAEVCETILGFEFEKN